MLVRKAGYFRDTALSLDKLANREFRMLWNKTLRVAGGYEFGAENESISSALGKNVLLGSLTRTGKALVWVLDLLEENHCINAIIENKINMEPLNQPTPVANTLLWKAGTFLYALIIFLNQNLGMLSVLGLTETTENWIKITGAFLYFLFTYYNFNQSTYNSKKP